jgi:hypothetical protein
MHRFNRAGLATRSLVVSAFGLLTVAGCGNEVLINTGGSGGTSGTGAGTTSTGKTSSVATTSTVVTSTSTGADVCSSFGETECLGAYPKCAPVYDDSCCPTCDPGPCADCEHYQFHHCAPFETVCGQSPMACGVTFGEACFGKPATCPNQYCGSNPGCVDACQVDSTGTCSPACRPVTVGSCTSVCNPPPPACPPGFVPEQDGTCFTGYCIPAGVCAP